MRKLTASVVALALAFAFLTFAGTPARGNEIPSGPTVTASAETLGIRLAWSYPETAGAVGYIIHRGDTAGHEERWPLTDFPVPGHVWFDEEVVPGTTYYYVIVPVFGDGSEGFRSNEVAATAVSPADDRQLVHFHMDEAEALVRTAAGDELVALSAPPVMAHGRVLLALQDVVTLTGADLTLSADGKVVTHKLPTGRVMTVEVGKSTMAFSKATRTDTCHPVLKNGQVYLPLRWFVDAMQGQLTFNPLDDSVTFEMAR